MRKGMKFTSKKDISSIVTIIGICSFLIAVTIFGMFDEGLGTNKLLIIIPIVSVVGLLLWIFFDTHYELTKTDLIYKSGPIRGKIKVIRIREIVKDKTLWGGLKPATGRNGLILKYDKHKEIYITPKTNDTFIKKILELNSAIKIIT